MALDTAYDLRRSVIYCVYACKLQSADLRVIPQLDRLKDLGVTIFGCYLFTSAGG